MIVFKQTLPVLVVLAGSVLACMSAQAAPPSCGAVSSVERRIVERANGDVESLRSFVRLTAIVHGVNMVDVRENLDNWRAAVECRRQVAAAAEQANQAAAVQATPIDTAVVVSQR